MIVMVVMVTVTAADVEAPRDLPHARRDHLGRTPAQVSGLNSTLPILINASNLMYDNKEGARKSTFYIRTEGYINI